MRNRTLETAATAIVVASLVFGMVVTMPVAPDNRETPVAADIDRTSPSGGFGLLKQPELF